MARFYAFSLGGSTGEGFRYPAPQQWAGPTSFTVEFWMRAILREVRNTWILDIGNYGNYEDVHWALSRDKDGKWQTQFGFWGDVQNIFPFAVFAGKWVHIATVFDASNRKLTTYVNGQEPPAGTKTLPENSPVKPREPGLVRIGWNDAAAAIGWQPLSGLLDEVRIWDTPLSAQLIRDRMYQRLVVPHEHLISYVNLAAIYSVAKAPTVAGSTPAALGALPPCRDLVTNKPVEILGHPDFLLSELPTGGRMISVGAGEVAIFQEPVYQGHSWLFPEKYEEHDDARADLLSCDLGSVRVGDQTMVRIFGGPGYTDLSQETLSDLPSMTETKLASKQKTARSLQVVSTKGGEHGDWALPGVWAIASSDGRYLSAYSEDDAIPLRMSNSVDDEGLFQIETLSMSDGHHVVAIRSPKHSTYLTAPATPDGRLAFLDVRPTERASWLVAAEPGAHRFSIGTSDGRWVASRVGDSFELTRDAQRKTIFTLAVRAAADESQVGVLPESSVAFFEHPSYWGKAWVFYSTHADLRSVPKLPVKSMRLGPHTGVTLFDLPDFAIEGNAADLLRDTPDMSGSTYKGKEITSLKLWKVVSPGGIGLESATTLSQDYHTVNGKVESFVAYRTSLSLPQNVSTVEVRVTDSETLEIAGERRGLKANESWTVPANPFGRVIVTSEATNLFCAGLRIRTDTMAADQYIVLFPDQEVHTRLATLEQDALWNAKDHSGQYVLRDRDSLKPEGAAHLQKAITSMMAATQYTSSTLDVREPDAAPRVQVTSGGVAAWQWATHSGAVNSRGMKDAGWMLDFDATSGSAAQLASRLKTGARHAPVFTVLSQRDVRQLLADSHPSGPPILGSLWDDWEKILNVGKAIAHVIVTKIEDEFAQLKVEIRYVTNEVCSFVVKTVTQAAMVAQRILVEVVTAVNKAVEWLAYMFNWDDILKTQKKLADDINRALVRAAELVRDQAPVAVNRAMTDFRNQIKTVLDGVKKQFGEVKKLQFDETRRQSSATRQPLVEEKVHWFLAKMIPQSGVAALASASSPLTVDAAAVAHLQPFFDTLRNEAEKIVDDNVRAAFREALKCFCDAFTDTNAGVAFDDLIVGLLSVLEALAGVAINVMETIIKLLLGLLGEVLDRAKEMLNEKIPIPGLTDLWQLIAPGTKFSVLNVTTLAVAIPTTIILKLREGRTVASDPEVSMLGGPAAAPETEVYRSVAYSAFVALYGAIAAFCDGIAAAKMAPSLGVGVPREFELQVVAGEGRPPRWPTPSRPSWADFFGPLESLEALAKPFEAVSWVLQAGMVVTSWPGYPDFSSTPPYNEDEFDAWALRFWGYGAALAVFDAVSLLGSGKKLRRAGIIENIAASVFGVFHLWPVFGLLIAGLKSDRPKKVVYLATIQGCCGALPEALSFLLLPECTVPSGGATMFAHMGVQVIAAFTDCGINLASGPVINPPEQMSFVRRVGH